MTLIERKMPYSVATFSPALLPVPPHSRPASRARQTQAPFTLPISLPLRFESSVNCDVTGDGQVNVGDALQVLREAIGLRPNGCFQ